MNWHGTFEFETLAAPDRNGNRAVLWRSDSKNSLADEGERNVLDSYLRNLSHPSQFFLRVFNDTPTETDSLRSLTGEPGFANGYAQQQVLRSSNAAGWPTLGTSGGNAQASSKQVTFDCTLAYTVSYAVLATTSDNSGLLISYGALSTTQSLASGDQLRVTYKPSLS